MIVILVMLVVVLVVIAGVVGMVLVGIEGRRLDRYPQLAQFLTRAAQHLNGEAADPDRAADAERPADRPRVHEHV